MSDEIEMITFFSLVINDFPELIILKIFGQKLQIFGHKFYGCEMQVRCRQREALF